MTHPTPEFGTTRYLCPVECGWHHDVPPPHLNDLDWTTADAVDAQDGHEYVASVIRQAGLQQMDRTERALREHLETHTAEDFARVIHGLRVENEKLRSEARQSFP